MNAQSTELKEKVKALFQGYLSRNLLNLRRRIKALGWDEEILCDLERVGAIKKILDDGHPATVHFEKRIF